MHRDIKTSNISCNEAGRIEDEAAPLLDAADDKPYYRTLAAMLLFDQGETERAREFLDGVGKWIQQQREQDPDSAVPAQQDWRTWSIQLAVYQEASRELNGSDDTEGTPVEGAEQAP